jgi:transposase
MAGRFNGLSDEQWAQLEPLFQSSTRTRGYPRAEARKTLNSILFILFTGARWCDLPDGPIWGKRSTSHRWLKIWSPDGTLERVWQHVLNQAHADGLSDWSAAWVDGSFSPWQGRRTGSRAGS